MDDLKIKFDGETHQIEANTLINSLLHFTNLTHEINRELGTDRKIEIKVNALKEGSFLVHIVIEATLIENIKGLFTKDNIDIAASIFTVVGGLFAFAKFLKGGKPEVIESNDISTKIKNTKGDVTYIDNRVIKIYQNNKLVRETISQEFETLESDPNVTGFELLDKEDKPIVQIVKEDFAAIANSDASVVSADETIILKAGFLVISTLSFDKNVKWNFYFEGNKISAHIKDEEFVKLIERGEKFSKGDSLEAEFEIRQQFDESINTYINKSYKITKIIKHIGRAEQGRLEFPKANPDIDKSA